MREVAAELERPVLLFSGGKDSIVLLRLAEKAFRPARFPFPLMHVDTGHNFPEVIEFRDRRVAELGERLIVASVQESIDAGRVVEETGPRASRNRLQTTTLLDAIAEHGFDAAFGGARRDEERARAKERIFSFRDDFGGWDPKAPAPRAVEPLQRPRPHGRARARVPALATGPSSTCGSTSSRGASRSRRSTSPTSARSSRATGCSTRSRRTSQLHRRRGAVRRERALPHGRRHDAAPAPSRSTARDARRRRGRDRGDRRSPSAARRAPTTASPRPRWRTARCRATSDGDSTSCASPPPARVDDGKSTLIGRLLYDAKAILADQLDVEACAARDGELDLVAADRRPARRARAGHHDRRRLPLLRHRAARVHPRRHARATCSTRATWSPAPRPPTSPSSSSTRATACVEQTRRHAFIASLLGIPHLVVAVNKMDLVDYAEERLRRDRARLLRASRAQLARARRRLHPDQRAARRQRRRALRARCRGTTARRCSSTSRPSTSQADRNLDDAALPGPVRHPRRRQRLPRLRGPGRRRRRCAPATRSSCCPPSGVTTVAAIDTLDGPLDEAFPPMCVTVRLADDARRRRAAT